MFVFAGSRQLLNLDNVDYITIVPNHEERKHQILAHYGGISRVIFQSPLEDNVNDIGENLKNIKKIEKIWENLIHRINSEHRVYQVDGDDGSLVALSKY